MLEGSGHSNICKYCHNIHQEGACKIMEFNKKSTHPYKFELDENSNILVMLVKFFESWERDMLF
jgi:hypothetical protein